MQIKLNIPDEIARAIVPEGKDPLRAVLEALALEGYRSKTLDENDLRDMLGFHSNLQVHGFLKERGVYVYDESYFDEDEKSASALLIAKLQAERAPTANR